MTSPCDSAGRRRSTDAEGAQRYEAHLDGDLAGFLDHIVKRGRIALVHTEVLEAYRGRGLAEQLARFALDDARRRGLRVIVTARMSGPMWNVTPRRTTSWSG